MPPNLQPAFQPYFRALAFPTGTGCSDLCLTRCVWFLRRPLPPIGRLEARLLRMLDVSSSRNPYLIFTLMCVSAVNALGILEPAGDVA